MSLVQLLQGAQQQVDRISASMSSLKRTAPESAGESAAMGRSVAQKGARTASPGALLECRLALAAKALAKVTAEMPLLEAEKQSAEQEIEFVKEQLAAAEGGLLVKKNSIDADMFRCKSSLAALEAAVNDRVNRLIEATEIEAQEHYQEAMRLKEASKAAEARLLAAQQSQDRALRSLSALETAEADEAAAAKSEQEKVSAAAVLRMEAEAARAAAEAAAEALGAECKDLEASVQNLRKLPDSMEALAATEQRNVVGPADIEQRKQLDAHISKLKAELEAHKATTAEWTAKCHMAPPGGSSPAEKPKEKEQVLALPARPVLDPAMSRAASRLFVSCDVQSIAGDYRLLAGQPWQDRPVYKLQSTEAMHLFWKQSESQSWICNWVFSALLPATEGRSEVQAPTKIVAQSLQAAWTALPEEVISHWQGDGSATFEVLMLRAPPQ